MISRSTLLRMRKFSDKLYRENQNTFYVQIFFFKSSHLWDKTWKRYGTVRQATGDITVPHIACWIDKATKTHSECVIFIVFPL